jgi:hypothetical protein
MSEAKLPDVKQDRFIQIGIVVKSVDETIKYFQQMYGFKDFEVRYVDYPTATYYGKVAGYKGKRGFFYLGPVQIELIELVSGKTIHEDFLKNKGEGLKSPRRTPRRPDCTSSRALPGPTAPVSLISIRTGSAALSSR